jgi:hypothetical protein
MEGLESGRSFEIKAALSKAAPYLRSRIEGSNLQAFYGESKIQQPKHRSFLQHSHSSPNSDAALFGLAWPLSITDN